MYDVSQALVRSVRSREAFISTFVQPRPGVRVLDIGCGTATVLRHLPGVDYTGIDSNPRYIESARARHGFATSSRRFVCGDVATLPVADGDTFDVVMALGVFHHLDDSAVVGVCKNVLTLLAEGGRLVTHDPVLAPGQSFAARWFVTHDRGKHVRSEQALLDLVRAAGFDPRATVTHSSLRIPYSEVIISATHSSAV